MLRPSKTILCAQRGLLRVRTRPSATQQPPPPLHARAPVEAMGRSQPSVRPEVRGGVEPGCEDHPLAAGGPDRLSGHGALGESADGHDRPVRRVQDEEGGLLLSGELLLRGLMSSLIIALTSPVGPHPNQSD